MADAAPTARPATTDEAFATLTRRHVDRAFRLAWAILGEAGEAEDAAQDAFATAWDKRSSLRDPARFQPWFERVLVNVCRERLRRRRRSPVRAVDPLPEPGVGDESHTVQLRDAVGTALADLDPDHRIVVVLRYWADLTVDDIAERVGVPAGTVKSRLHYALRALEPALEEIR